ncbi:hypothetical protein M0Q50_08020 [bacterium]|jgi:hypothetical protein|nr:hypothetical protein [bacterium]
MKIKLLKSIRKSFKIHEIKNPEGEFEIEIWNSFERPKIFYKFVTSTSYSYYKTRKEVYDMLLKTLHFVYADRYIFSKMKKLKML